MRAGRDSKRFFQFLLTSVTTEEQQSVVSLLSPLLQLPTMFVFHYWSTSSRGRALSTPLGFVPSCGTTDDVCHSAIAGLLIVFLHTCPISWSWCNCRLMGLGLGFSWENVFFCVFIIIWVKWFPADVCCSDPQPADLKKFNSLLNINVKKVNSKYFSFIFQK